MLRKIDAALEYIGDNGDEMRPWLLWQLEEILDGPQHIGMEDCNSSVLMALLAILVPVFNARLAGAGGDSSPRMEGKLLTLILGDGGVSDGATGA